VAPPLTAPTADWAGEDVSVEEILRRLGVLRLCADTDDVPELRTNVMTHMAWIPPEWGEAAEQTLEGLAERHPSRTLLLVPLPDEPDGLDAYVSLRRFKIEGQERQVSTEVIELRLRGGRASAPASIVWPLLISDLPVFLRWRGEPPWGSPELDQLVGVTDRLVVDSREWDEPRFEELAQLFARTAVSDIAWARTHPWRWALAGLWPGISGIERLSVRAPRSEAELILRWLRSRLRREIELDLAGALERSGWQDAAEIEGVAVDGVEVPPPRLERKTASDLLSDQLDQFGHDVVYEAALLLTS
jgi:glucose-6-phosphate dehydrogenase assembly protein OpcA